MIAIRADVNRLREMCEQFGVARLEVFGSASRGEARQDSDLDLLYIREQALHDAQLLYAA